MNNLKVDKANQRNAGIGGLNQRGLEKHNETLKTKNQTASHWDDDIRGGLRGTAHLAGLRSAGMRSLDSKQEVTFCSRSPAITPPGHEDVIKQPDVQPGARTLLSHKINMLQFPRSIRSGLLRQHSDSTVFDFSLKTHLSRNSLELHLARLHLTY